MGVQMNIKSAEAVDLARALAEKTGESLTQAVTVALRQRMDGLTREADRAWHKDEVAKIQREVQELMRRQGITREDVKRYEDDMYDEWGVPR